MSIESDLHARIVEVYTDRFRQATYQMGLLVENDKRTPSDTGHLKAGVVPGASSFNGSSFTAEIKSVATNAGFDYPAFLDVAARIAPTKRKYLHFFVHGQEVFSKGFDNRHRGWWKKAVTEANWTKALGRAK